MQLRKSSWYVYVQRARVRRARHARHTLSKVCKVGGMGGSSAVRGGQREQGGPDSRVVCRGVERGESV